MSRYDSAIARLNEALSFGINPSLDGITALTDALGRPQDSFRAIQVTGTNGKTSVARIAGAFVAVHGHRVGVYTSPHLVSYTERMEIEGAPVSPDDLAQALETVFDAAGGLGGDFTEFELLTAAALVAFRDAGVQWAVLEVGMGGRWDATSVVAPAVAVITGVDLDHTERLGTTREQIAADKAHIIKPGSVAIIGPGCEGLDHIFAERARVTGSQIVRVRAEDADVTWRVVRKPGSPGGDLVLDIAAVRPAPGLRVRAPSYQAPNVATAYAATGTALWTPLDQKAIRAALTAMTFPGRFELLREYPPLVIDGAHNPGAALALAGAIVEAFGSDRPVVVLAVLADKDAEGIVRALASAAHRFVVTENGSPRCMSASDLAAVVAGVTGSEPAVVPDLEAAVAGASAGGRGVVVTGSLYTAGAVRALLCA